MPAPIPSSVFPNSGPTSGGTSIRINGANFQPGASVTFVGVATPASVIGVTPTTIDCLTPAGMAAGPVDVRVKNLDLGEGTLPAGFSYANAAPSPQSVLPASGSTQGGTLVTITGSGFQPGATVRFGVTVANVSLISGNVIVCTSPPSAAPAVVNVRVTNPDGQIGTMPAAFTYGDPPPNPLSISPTSGPTSGGTPVTINGTGFQVGATVAFDALVASVTSVTPTAIVCTTPGAGTTVASTVRVTNLDGQSGALGGAFIFENPDPTLSTVSPATGPTSGGTQLTLAGTGFLSGATVKVGTFNATVSQVTPLTILCLTPPNSAVTPCNVRVTNPGGGTSTLPAAFTYDDPPPAPLTVTPASGTTDGGTAVTIGGTGFRSGATVAFDGAPAVVVSVASNSINCLTPPHAPGGPVAVRVTNLDGKFGTAPASFTFTGPTPALATLEPAAGPTTGGTLVTINGTGFQPDAIVFFGAEQAIVISVTPTAIVCLTPANATLTPVEIEVTNPSSGLSVSGGSFTFAAPPRPNPVSMTPVTGPSSGGTPVTIGGTDFDSGVKVTFGGVQANVTSASTTSINCVSPARVPAAANPVDVRVINSDGQFKNLPMKYLFDDPAPTIAGIAPPNGASVEVTITGTGFMNNTQVTINGMPAEPIISVLPNAIVCTSPNLPDGDYPLVVTNPDGKHADSVFSYP